MQVAPTSTGNAKTRTTGASHPQIPTSTQIQTQTQTQTEIEIGGDDDDDVDGDDEDDDYDDDDDQDRCPKIGSTCECVIASDRSCDRERASSRSNSG